MGVTFTITVLWPSCCPSLKGQISKSAASEVIQLRNIHQQCFLHSFLFSKVRLLESPCTWFLEGISVRQTHILPLACMSWFSPEIVNIIGFIPVVSLCHMAQLILREIIALVLTLSGECLKGTWLSWKETQSMRGIGQHLPVPHGKEYGWPLRIAPS